MSAPNMSLSTGFSPKPLGMILSLRRSSTNSRSRRFVVRANRRCVTGNRLRNRRARSAERWRNRRGYRPPIDARSPAKAADSGCDPRLEFRPRIGRDLSGEIAHSMRQAALAGRAGEALLRILLGDADKVAPPATNGEVAAALIPGAKLTTMQHVGHYDFLAECTPAGDAM